MDADAENVVVYQLHILLQGVSPAIWRRLLVRSDSSIGDLHYTIQIAMGWSDNHLNRFLLHGRWYGIPHIGGRVFAESARKSLSQFELRIGERLLDEYDLRDCWRHQVRLERKLPFDPAQAYSVCIGGKRRVPGISRRSP